MQKRGEGKLKASEEFPFILFVVIIERKRSNKLLESLVCLFLFSLVADCIAFVTSKFGRIGVW